MQTPEEIKKGLEYCNDLNLPCSSDCPYHEKGILQLHCQYMLTVDALALIRQLEEQVPKWISVEDRLPEKCEYVLCIVLYGEDAWDHELCFLLNGSWVTPGRHDGKVTHWMPLPEPPKEVPTDGQTSD